jgi:AhpD family alkylhydroperoxidase
MSLFKVPSHDEVAPEAQTIFDNLKKLIGKVPNLYATIGYSANALNSYLAFVQAQAKGTFRAKEREAIYLIVSQLNGCEYCLASHTASAIKNGWTEEQTLLLRSGKLEEGSWPVLFKLIQSVIANKGDVEDKILNEYFAAGNKEKNLMDLMTLISVMSYTNYVYRLIKVPIDFPEAKKI